jgi:hypothetical protein
MAGVNVTAATTVATKNNAVRNRLIRGRFFIVHPL